MPRSGNGMLKQTLTELFSLIDLAAELNQSSDQYRHWQANRPRFSWDSQSDDEDKIFETHLANLEAHCREMNRHIEESLKQVSSIPQIAEFLRSRQLDSVSQLGLAGRQELISFLENPLQPPPPPQRSN